MRSAKNVRTSAERTPGGTCQAPLGSATGSARMASPLKYREAKFWFIGRTIGLACHVIGWFFPMYFAGRLESGNVVEYETAASHAAVLGLSEFAADLLVMAGVEKEHELFFLSAVTEHRLLPLVSTLYGWGKAPRSAQTNAAENASTEAAD